MKLWNLQVNKWNWVNFYREKQASLWTINVWIITSNLYNHSALGCHLIEFLRSKPFLALSHCFLLAIAQLRGQVTRWEAKQGLLQSLQNLQVLIFLIFSNFHLSLYTTHCRMSLVCFPSFIGLFLGTENQGAGETPTNTCFLFLVVIVWQNF